MEQPNPITLTIHENPNAHGLAIVVTNQYEGTSNPQQRLPFTKKDGDLMEEALRKVGFAVCRKDNADKQTMQDMVRAAAKYNYPASYKCFAFVFSGHGGINDHIYSHESNNTLSRVNVTKDLLEPLQPGNSSSSMAKLPKIFFIDACRGKNGMEAIAKGDDDQKLLVVPKEGNFLIANATMPGYVSYGDGTKSQWMPKVAELIPKSPKSILDLVTEVNNIMQKKNKHVQVAQSNSTLWATGICFRDLSGVVADDADLYSEDTDSGLDNEDPKANEVPPDPKTNSKSDPVGCKSRIDCSCIQSKFAISGMIVFLVLSGVFSLWYPKPDKIREISLLNERPKFQQLISLGLPEHIGKRYVEFGAQLLEDETGKRTDNIRHKHRDDPKAINREILFEWLEGSGRLPVEWATLISVLKDIGLTEVADDIDSYCRKMKS